MSACKSGCKGNCERVGFILDKRKGTITPMVASPEEKRKGHSHEPCAGCTKDHWLADDIRNRADRLSEMRRFFTPRYY